MEIIRGTQIDMKIFGNYFVFIYEFSEAIPISMTKTSESDPSERISLDSLSILLDGIMISGCSSFLAITSCLDDGRTS